MGDYRSANGINRNFSRLLGRREEFMDDESGGGLEMGGERGLIFQRRQEISPAPFPAGPKFRGVAPLIPAVRNSSSRSRILFFSPKPGILSQPSLLCHRRSLHRIFMWPCTSAPRAHFPHIYATVARPDTDPARETFSPARFSSAKNALRHPRSKAAFAFTRPALV